MKKGEKSSATVRGEQTNVVESNHEDELPPMTEEDLPGLKALNFAMSNV